MADEKQTEKWIHPPMAIATENDNGMEEKSSIDEYDIRTLLSNLVQTSWRPVHQAHSYNDAITQQIALNKDKDKSQSDKQLSDYANLSDTQIIERLQTIASDDLLITVNIMPWLTNNPRLLGFIREYAIVLTNYVARKMELELYQVYIEITKHTLPWLRTSLGTLLALCEFNVQEFFKLHHYIESHVKNIENDFRMITEKLTAMTVEQQQQQRTSYSTLNIDIKIIISLIIRLVQTDQQELRVECLKKRYLLFLHAKNVTLLYEFFQLEFDYQQLEIAQHIWKVTVLIAKWRQNSESQKVTDVDYITKCNKQIETMKTRLCSDFQTKTHAAYALPTQYCDLKIQLLMKIIETRQLILNYILELNDEYKPLFPLHCHQNQENSTMSNVHSN